MPEQRDTIKVLVKVLVRSIKRCRSEKYELSLKCKHYALVEALSSVMNLGVLEVAQILPLGGMWAEIPYRMLDFLLSPTYCVHQLVGL